MSNLPKGMRESRGTFYLDTKVDGKRKWINLGKNKAQALIKYSELTGVTTSKEKTFGDITLEWLKTERFTSKADSTKEKYMEALSQVLAVFKDAPAKEITHAQIADYMDARGSVHGANRELRLMKFILSLGARRRWCGNEFGVHAATNVEPREVKYVPRQRIISPAEWQAIREATTNTTIHVFMDLALSTGMRIGDLLDLTWGDIGDDVFVDQNKLQNHKFGVQIRYEMNDHLREILSRAKRLHGRSGNVVGLYTGDTPVIHTRAMKKYTYYGFRAMWRRVVEKAGCPDVHIHDIRRTAISRYGDENGSPQAFSGHESEQQADDYWVRDRAKTVTPMTPRMVG